MITDEIRRYASKSILCWLATVSEEGIPNVSPKEIFTFYDESTLLIAHIASPQSIRNIQKNENVCVSFIDIFVQKGFQLKGKAEIISKFHPDFQTLVIPLATLAGEKFPIAAIIKMEVTRVKQIVAPKYALYPETTEEEQIESAMKTYNVQPLR
ncbi:pyridoxamine 5'-phosphate oxidase family protein [Adhaeribacter radiodurans]|uniref:Pyridoxamine 5'-phosphate oxidase family protein n=1 Tax=Adhaeribacter radiodurans TaxID=2745197 RepID=A0A7L7L3Y0_9BACT|nr:pyridoxamine 5'-phosphate oxidase family protein [Adhaeribacter radiodurans]QMU27518.1 pyridoxamine 5'-phosphate oxidase family protein [Adhaeribacter radiodurans]